MKIAICNVQEFNPTIGGIERVSVSLAEELIKKGVEVLFIACRKSPYSKPYTLPAKQWFLPKPLDYCLENVQAMASIIKEEKVDFVVMRTNKNLDYLKKHYLDLFEHYSLVREKSQYSDDILKNYYLFRLKDL